MKNAGLNAVVAQRIEVTPRLIKLRVVPDGWELPDFIAGQYTVLGLPGSAPRSSLSTDEAEPPVDPEKLIRRAYSVASSSVTKEYVEFYVGLVSSGALSSRLFALQAGDPVFMANKFKGIFTLSQVPSNFNIVLAATGTGVAPYMSMIRTEVEAGLKHRFAVIHGACHSSDLGYNSELKLMASMSDAFDYFPIISHPHEERSPWKGHVGFVQKLWTDGVIKDAWGFQPKPDNTQVFLCGNPLMIDAMTEILVAENFTRHSPKSPGQIHSEQYFVKV